jgi:N-hydroxyarylamine O-acetyltransferase
MTELATTTDEWTVERLDVDAYLHRVGFTGPLAPDLATLRTLHRAHVTTIPFENLDVILGRGVSVDLDDVQAKLVAQRRGGYCYEHGILFAAVLARIGFEVERLLVRTGDPLEHPRPRSHMVLRVTVDGAPWLADVGFGSGLLEPIPFAPAGPFRQGAWWYEIVQGPDGMLRLRQDRGEGWTTTQTLVTDRVYLVDVAVANENTSTSPGSPFTRLPRVLRIDDDQLRTLAGLAYSVDRPGEPTVQRTIAAAELGPMLRQLGLDLPPDDVAALAAFTAAGGGPT